MDGCLFTICRLYKKTQLYIVVDADSFLLVSTKVDANTEMSLLFLNPREAKFPAGLLATTH